MRPDWDDTWLEVARVMGRRSVCSRAKVGAVIVSPENIIVATGYNGPPANFLHADPLPSIIDACDGSGPGAFCMRGKYGPSENTVQSYTDCPSIHAEQNALNFCDRTSRLGGTLYVTSDVCYTCAKNIANSGLLRVVVAVDDREYRVPGESYELLNACNIMVQLVRP